MTKKAGIITALFATLGLASGASQAVVISNDTPYQFNWVFNTGSYDLTGNGSLTVSGFGSNQLTLEVTLNNTSPNPGQGGDRLVGFGFGIDPNATSVQFVDVNDGGMRTANFVQNGTLVANVPGVEICAWGGNNCSGGSNGGIFAGGSDTFGIRLGGNWGSSVNIDPIGVRYQTGAGSFTFSTPPDRGVPEPNAVGLFLLGVAGLRFVKRRQKR